MTLTHRLKNKSKPDARISPTKKGLRRYFHPGKEFALTYESHPTFDTVIRKLFEAYKKEEKCVKPC
jgi:hypothetical protein